MDPTTTPNIPANPHGNVPEKCTADVPAHLDPPQLRQQQYPPQLRQQLRQQLLQQLRIVGAIVKKQFKHTVRYRLVLVSRILMPIVWLLPVIFMGIAFSGNMATDEFVRHTGINDYLSFLILGTILWQFVNVAFYEIGFALRIEMWFGTLEQNWVAPMNRFAFLIGKSVFSLVISLVYMTFCLLFAKLFFNFNLDTANLLGGLAIIIVSLFIFYGVGFMFCGFTLIVKEAGPLAEIIGMSLPILCGASFPITVLPGWMQLVSRFIPLTYSVDCLRSIFLGTKTILPLHLEIIILGVSAVVVPYIGYRVFIAADKQTRKMGNLGHY